MYFLPSRLTGDVGYAIWPRRKTWTLWQGLTYPVLARLVWAITFGLPPSQSPVTERGVPLLARLWYGRGTAMQPVDLAFASKEEENRWIGGEAVDPSGSIVPQKYLAGFWIRSKTKAGPAPTSTTVESSAAKSSELPEVVLYLVGGGYITGHALEASRVFDIARMTDLPVLSVNYRKSVTSSLAFPAPLQDTISAYTYLVRKGYTRIAVAGDSAGAGLALALMQYLGNMVLDERQQQSQRGEGQGQMKLPPLPVKACFYSPWADLTFSHDYRATVHFDISKSKGKCPVCLARADRLTVHPTMLAVAASAYTSGLQRYPNTGDSKNIGAMQRSHPFFSPALRMSLTSPCQGGICRC